MASVLITGILKDAFGAPIPNYEFFFEAIRTSDTLLNTTNAKFTTSGTGSYSFTLEYGTYTLKAKAQRDLQFKTIASNILVFSQVFTNKDIQYLLTSQEGLENIDQTLLEAVLQIKADLQNALTFSVVDKGNVSLASGIYPTPEANGQGGYFSSLWYVTTGGTVSGVVFTAGDQLLYSATAAAYRKIDNTDLVSSVNGMVGTVVVTTITGNAGTATTLQTARTIGVSGDGTGTATSFNGSANITIPFTLATVATAGTYKSVTVDAKGRVTTGSNPTTLAGYGITDAQPVDSDLTALAALSTTGIITRTAAGAATTLSIGVTGTGLSITNADGIAGNPTVASNATNLNTASAIVARDAAGNFAAGTITAALAGNASTATTLQTSRNITATGDVTGSASFNGSANATLAMTLASSGVTAGTYSNVTVDTKGRVTSGSNAGGTLSTANITGSTINSTPIGVTTPSTGTFTTLNTTGATAVGGDLTVTGNLVINGTTTTVNSTTMTVDDPIITLGGDTVPTADDGKDRGVEFRWYTGTTAKVGFFGFDDSTGKFTFIPDATNTSEVFSGATGTIVANLEGSVTGNASTATTLQTTRNISTTGDATGTTTFNGSANASIALTLATTGVTAGTYKSVTVDAKGRVTAATNPTTLAGYGITDAQPLDSDLTAFAGLSTNGIVVKTAAGTATTRSIVISGNGLSITNADGISGNPTITSNATNLNTVSTIVARDSSGNFSAGTITAALSGNSTTATTLATTRTIAISGDGTGTATSFNGSANITIPFTLSSSGVIAGTYRSVTVDAKGRVTAATNPTTLAGYGIIDAIPSSSKGVVNGVATLDATGKVTAAQLPLDGSAREAIRRSYQEAGYNLVDGSFELGDTLQNSSDVLLHKLNGKAYSWGGTFPKVVAAGATPATSGGIGAGAWVDQTQETLRSELSGNYGLTTNFSTTDSVNLITVSSREIKTKGFYSVGDGGGASFHKITTDQNMAGKYPAYYTSGGDKNYCVFDAVGNVFALEHKRTIFARKVGIALDGINDDAPRLQVAIDSGVFSVINTYTEPLSIKSRLVVNPNVAVRGGFEFNSIHKHTSLPSAQVGTCYITYRDGFDDTTDAAIVIREYAEFSGYVINHPNQVQPGGTNVSNIVAQPWAIATATKVLGAGPADGIKVKDIHFANSYRALSLDGAAQYDVSNISGQPLLRGIEIDRQYDMGVIDRAHFWTFSWGVDTPVYNWIHTNGMAFDICRCDGAEIINTFAYGYRVTYRFGSNGFGSPWCTLVNACADASVEPVRNDACNIVKFTGGEMICTTRNAFAARIAGSIARSFDFNGTTFFGDAAASAAHVASTGGSVNFNSCYLKGENGNDMLFGVVNSSDTTVVSVSGAPNNQNYYRNVYGRDNTYLNGMRLPILGDSQIPAASENNFRMLNWSAGAPVGWSFLSGGSTNNITQITNGIKVHVNAGETITLVFQLPLFTNDNFIFEANIKASGVAAYNYNFDVNLMDVGNNSDNILTLIGVSDGGFTGEAVRYTCNGHQITPSSFFQRGLRINTSGFGECNCDIEITNMRLVMPSRWSERSYINNSPAYLGGTWYGMQLQNHSVDGGVWTGFNDSVPTSGGEWLRPGDKIIKRIPTVGQPKSWVCNVAGKSGTIGTLVSEGNL